MERKKQIEYFHFYGESRGDRYFKVDWVNGTCIQVVVESGWAKKGRPHMLGIYKLALPSFRGTYYWYFGRKDTEYSKMLQTTENQFNRAFDKMTLFIQSN